MPTTPVFADNQAARSPASRLALPPSLRGLLPGLVLAGIIGAAAVSMRELPGLVIFSPMILAVILGVIFANVVGVPAQTRAGIAFCQRSVLRFAIVLLGFQVTLGQLASIGAAGLAAVALTLVATFVFTIAAGRALGVERKLAELIAAGTSICGASAIVAANSVTGARQEDVAYAVACITLFGTVAMLTLPLLAPVAGLDGHAFGIWAGASIHEIAQVVGASFQNGAEAGEAGTVAKLARVMMLAPVVIGLGALAARSGARQGNAARVPMPWFVFGFIAIVLFNSAVELPAELRQAFAIATTALLSLGLAAMGLQADISQIRSRGLRPLLLAFSAFVFIAGFGLVMVKLAV